MARYGDLDAVKLKVQRYLIPNTDEVGMVDAAVAERWFLKLLDEAPTADAVPKSEVERLEAEIAQYQLDLHYSICREETAKAEVAREIFEEIRKRAYSEKGFFVVNSDIDDFIAELKKKYTGDDQSCNDCASNTECEKATHIENYSIKGCMDFKEKKK